MIPSGGGKRGWYLEAGVENDKEWHFYSGEGKLRKYEHRGFQGKNDKIGLWYAFDENGRMYENELFVGPGSGNIREEEYGEETSAPTRYAYPDGRLAEANSWVLLNHDGTLHIHDDNCGFDCDADTDWYYFEKADTSEGEFYKNAEDAGYPLGEIAAGKEIDIPTGDGKKPAFGFGRDGVMYSRQWAQWDENGELVSDAEDDVQMGFGCHYYKYQGERMYDGWLPVEGIWYEFDEQGQCVFRWDPEEGPLTFETASPSDSVPVASSSNVDLKLWLVDSVSYEGEHEIEAVPGQELLLKFNVELASSSNTGKPVLKKSRHDFWMPDSKRGSIKVEVDEEASTCTVKYKTSTAYIGEEIVRLVIDGKASEAVSIITKAPDTKKGAADTVKDILGTLDSSEMSNVSASTLRDSLASVYTGGESEEAPNEEIKKEIKAELLKTRDNVESLESRYAMEKKITVEEPAVSEAAQNLLPADKLDTIRVIGGSLNAEEKATVQLKVEEGDSAAAERVNTGSVKVVFDITLDGVTDSSNLDIPVIIVMPLPTSLNNYKVKLYHIHGDEEPEEVTAANVSYSENTITFVADRFSNYVFAADGVRDTNPARPSGGSGGGGGGSSRSSAAADTMSGNWQQDERGWRFQLTSGEYAANSWGRIHGNWYYFGEDTYMMTGWVTVDGQWYYLSQEQGDNAGKMQTGWIFDTAYNRWFYLNASGAMQTGWQQINNVWYYLNPVADGTGGAMLTEQWIGDYYVGADGAWAESMTR